MKFLVFNLAVAAALVFLFTADRGDVQKMAGQVHDAAADVKAYAKRTLNKGEKILNSGIAASADAPEPAQRAAPAKPAPAPVPAPRQTNGTPPKLKAVPPPPAPPKASRIANAAPAAPPLSLKPEVAKRRREVLDGLPPANPTATIAATAPKLKEGTKLMTAADRRKELLSLAEEMELLYARSISR